MSQFTGTTDYDTAVAQGSSLLTPDFLRKLESLALATRQSLPGPRIGLRRSPRLGASVEFSDFRNYTPGDDYRRIDWNAYARLERLFIRLYRAEEDLTVSFLLDTSRSMAWGQPSKLDLSRQVAGALAYVALLKDEQVRIAALGDDLPSYFPPVGNPAQVHRVWGFLGLLQSFGKTDLGKTLTSFASRYCRRPGLSILVSDLLTDTDWRAGLQALRARQQEVVVIQVLAPEELSPEIAGHWQMVDDEDESSLEVTLTPRTLEAYRDRLAAYTREVTSFCHGHDISFVQLQSDLHIEYAVLRLLRRAQVVV